LLAWFRGARSRLLSHRPAKSAGGRAALRHPPGTPDGSPLQQHLGENLAAVIHFCAAVFILSLAAISFYFAHQESSQRARRNRRVVTFHRLCGWLILAAVGCVGIGGILHLTIW
jgi:hypothetical protein